MVEALKSKMNSMICSSIVAGIIGIIMVAFPEMSIKTIGLIAAIYIIAHGLTLIFLDIKASSYFIPFDGFLPGLLSVILGVLLILMPGVLPTVFTIVIGIWIISTSINTIKLALAVKGDNTTWILLLILGILDMVAGIIVILNPFEATLSITVFAGIMIIAHSIVNIVDMIVLKKDIKDLEKTISTKLKEITK